MKKILLALLAVVFLFGSCEKEGNFTPKKRISTVYVQHEDGPKAIGEEYTWNGHKLASKKFYAEAIDAYFDDVELVPTYDGKRIVRMDEKISGDYVEYLYSGKLLTHLVYHSGEQQATATLDHTNGKITRIFFPKVGNTNASDKCIQKIMQMFLTPEDVQKIVRSRESNTKTLAVTDNEFLFYWDGDNVSQVTNKIYNQDGVPSSGFTVSYEYDDMTNPFSMNWEDFGAQLNITMDIACGHNMNLSKNNPTKITTTLSITLSEDDVYTQTEVCNITYEYDGKYPVKQIRKLEGGTDIYEYEYAN